MLTWDEAFVAGPGACGGKGWNLARLHRYGFDVPEGAVLTASVYREVCARPPVAAALRELEGVGAERATDPDVQKRLEAARGALKAEALPAEVRSAVRDLAGSLGAVAVRSSALAEDGAEASFAGVHESFLDVGPEGVEAAVRDCWASLWTPRALAYRRRLGVTDESVACAVVICRSVPAVCAGVAFSCDPATGRRDLVVLEAAPGRGDAVVGGRVAPDRVVVRRNRGRIRTEGRTGQGVLTARQEVHLARLVVRVQWALGEGQDPQDVEWAHDGERFWLLQARPATRVPHHTFPGARKLPVYWSNANMKDAVPGVVSCLSWSFIREAIPDVLYAVPVAVGYPVPPGMEMVRRFQGHAYFDFTGMQWGFYDSIGLAPEEAVRSVGGHHPTLPVPPGDPMRGPEGRRRAWARLRMVVRLWSFSGELRRELERHYRETREVDRPDLDRLPWEGLGDLQERLNLLHDRLDPLVGFANAAMGGWQDLLEGLLRWLAGDEAPALLGRLLTGCGGVVSAEQGYRVFDLAAEARRDAAARAWLATGSADWRSLPQGSPFRRELGRYLDDYGHRAVYEADLMNPRWAEDPSYILDQVRAAMEMGGAPRERARGARMAAEEDLRRRAGWLSPLVFYVLGRVRRGLALREAAKSAMVASVVPGRRMALEMGRRLVEAGHLDRPEGIFHLARPDLEALMAREWDGRGARALARDRQEQRERWLREEPPDVIVQEGSGAWHPAATPEGGTLLRGLPLCPGLAEGVARVLRHPHEGSRLGPGDILVAPSTDPGWTPLFLRAGALVVETGGYLSHGAIVAREYGLPAVTNVAGAAERIPDGARVRVDGAAGVVDLSP